MLETGWQSNEAYQKMAQRNTFQREKYDVFLEGLNTNLWLRMMKKSSG